MQSMTEHTRLAATARISPPVVADTLKDNQIRHCNLRLHMMKHVCVTETSAAATELPPIAADMPTSWVCSAWVPHVSLAVATLTGQPEQEAHPVPGYKSSSEYYIASCSWNLTSHCG